MDKLPDLPDMMGAGMGLTEALAFWNLMMNSPDRDIADWWQKMREHGAFISDRAQGFPARSIVQ
jgi:hypothetical protein